MPMPHGGYLLFANWYKKNQLYCTGISSSCAVFTFNNCEITEDISSFIRLSCKMARIMVNGIYVYMCVYIYMVRERERERV